jgi:uncharacterized small protein (DUF1192 family)
MFEEDDADKASKKQMISVGDDLSTLSIDELKHRITVLEHEVDKHKQAIQLKMKTHSAADALFKSNKS